MKRWMLVLASIILVASDATGQTEPRFARLHVSLWPEYDRPAVLVMLQASLAGDVEVPVTVTLPMPARVGTPHAVATQAAGGTLVLAGHTIDVEGDWARVKVPTDMREVRLEYYADLTRADSVRRYIFQWPGGLDVAEVSYEVMQPIDAKNLSMDPPPDTESVTGEGLTFHLGNLGPKTRNDKFSIGLAYTKTTPTLTAIAIPPRVPAGGPTPGGMPATPVATPSGSGGTNILLLALMVVLGAAIGGFLVFVASKRPKRKS